MSLKRTVVSDLPGKVGEKVKIAGFVNVVRSHGKIAFADIVDRTGIVQIVGGENIAGLRSQFQVEVEGKVQERPASMVNEKIPTGKIEVSVESLKVLSESSEMPFDMGGEDLNLELPTLLDYRSLTLRHPKVREIFKVQAMIAKGFRESAEELGCVEVFTPTISASATEGGAEVFKVDYYGHEAFLVQSPQLYKQIMVGVFDRVYLFSHAYRSEPSITTRHLSEVTQMDCEMSFIESFDELLDLTEYMGVETIKKACRYSGVETPLISKVPRLTLREAQEIIAERKGEKRRYDPDLTPEDEKEICAWAKEEKKSDFVTITHFPTKKRAFYTMPDPRDPEFSLSFDVLFRGLEIASGSQRINDYDELLSAMRERGIKEEGFKMYLQAFKYGLPPEGGFSYGLERMTMKLLGLENVREASLFPRDMERVDFKLQKDETS